MDIFQEHPRGWGKGSSRQKSLVDIDIVILVNLLFSILGGDLNHDFRSDLNISLDYGQYESNILFI